MDDIPLGLDSQELINRVGYLATIDEAGLLGECLDALGGRLDIKNYGWEVVYEGSREYPQLVDALQRLYRVPRDLAEKAVGEWAVGDRSPLAVTEDVVDMYLQIARRFLHHRASEDEREFPPERTADNSRFDAPPQKPIVTTSARDVPEKIKRERARRRSA